MRSRRRPTPIEPAHADGTDLVRISARALIRLRQDGEGLPLHSTRILGTLAGPYLSAFKGRGMEFDETRPYQPGDDARSLHWRVTARTGRPHTKLFREERERSVLMWVDLRAPMWFATRGAFKSVVAARAAALLAWSAARHGDRVGGLVVSEDGHREIRPKLGRRAVLHLIRGIAEHPVPGESDAGTRVDSAASSLARLRRVVRPGSLVFLASDFRDFDARAISHVAQLKRHSDVVLLFLFDPLERALPASGRYPFSDGRQRWLLDAADAATQEAHERHFVAHEERLQGLCQRYRMYLLPCATDQELAAHLRRGLGLGAP